MVKMVKVVNSENAESLPDCLQSGRVVKIVKGEK
jgi:hypothetical protein